jgi:hypothetical protein
MDMRLHSNLGGSTIGEMKASSNKGMHQTKRWV